jgi:uncharacterized protein
MFKFLAPKEDGFFTIFDQLADCAVEGAQVFVDMLDHYGDAPAKVRRLRDIEHRGDEITHRAIEMLHTSFITPFDRDQIHNLVSHLDDIVDLMDSVVRRMSLYGVVEPLPELKEMALVLQRATIEIKKAIVQLRNLKNIDLLKTSCVEINRLENDGDALRDAIVAKLFREETDAINVLRWKEIFEDVESAIDRCEDVANDIEGVVLENA